MRRRNLSSLLSRACYWRRAFMLVFVLGLFTAAVIDAVCQEGAGNDRRPEPRLAEALSEKAKRQQMVGLVKEFADRAFGFESSTTRTLSIAKFADLLWKDDEATARDLFMRSLELSSSPGKSTTASADLTTQLRREVLALVSRHDASLANRLVNEYGSPSIDSENRTTDLRIANKLLNTQPDQATKFAEQNMNGGISFDLVFFLLRLRPLDEPKANNLFVQVLNYLNQERCIDPEMLILLGTYVYTFPTVPGESITPSTVKYVGIGPVMLPDITKPRPGVSPQLMLAYLSAATDVLSNPICAPNDRAKVYAASYLLLNKTSVVAPELASRISLAMQSIRQDVPRELLDDSTYKGIETRNSKSLSETLAEIEKRVGVEARDTQYFALVFDLWRRSDFENARLVNQRISDTALRERITRLIIFRECTLAIEGDGNTDKVERLSSSLPSGVERALIKLGLAELYFRKSDRVRAEESINAALMDARRLDGPRVPFLMLAAARELARIKSPDAVPLFSEVVKRLNEQSAEDLKGVSWREELSSGALRRDWSLEIKGVAITLSSALPDLMRADSHVVVETTLKLKNEAFLSEALLEVASVLLNGD